MKPEQITPDEIKAIREAAGLTQVRFAEELGVHSITLSRFERGVEPVTRVVGLALRELARQLKQKRKKKPSKT